MSRPTDHQPAANQRGQRTTHHFTDASIKKFVAPDPSGKPRFYWDAEVRGLGLRCSGTSASRSWVVQRKNQRRTLERADLLTVAQARDLALQWLREMGRGVDPKAAAESERKRATARGLTLGAAWENYLQNRRAGGLRDSTKVFYRGMLRFHLSDWQDTPIRELTPQRIQERHAEIIREIKQRGAGTGNGSANAAMRCLSAVIRHAQDQSPDLVLVNVGRAMRGRWAPEERRTRHIADRNLAQFYAGLATLDPYRRAACELLLLTGLRKMEVLALRWDEVDLEEQTITLGPTRNKSGRTFTCPLSSRATEILRLMDKRYRTTSEFVFPGRRRGTYLAEINVTLSSLAKGFGQGGLSAHDLRRCYGIAANASGVSLADLRRLLNHSTKQDTTMGYIVPRVEDLRLAQQRVTDHLLALCNATPAKPKRILRRTIETAA